MSIATVDLMEAITTAWGASGLDAAFKALWDSDYVAAEYPVLHDQEASPGQPLPYCVLGQSRSRTTDRMSGGAKSLREIRDVSLAFNVHASEADGDARSAKEIAAHLVAEVTKVFGGHPTQSPTGALTLDNGNCLLSQYQNDYGVRTGDATYQWILEYLFRLDVPVMITA